jgi:hypothetical protein
MQKDTDFGTYMMLIGSLIFMLSLILSRRFNEYLFKEEEEEK